MMPGDSRTVVQPRDFLRTDRSAPTERAAPRSWEQTVEQAGEGVNSAAASAPGQAQGRLGSIVLGGEAAPVGEAVPVEAKIGDVAGRPLLVNEFFEPSAARLRAEAERLDRQAWLLTDRPREGVIGLVPTVRNGLNDALRDELLRAEALSRLEPERQAGLRAAVEALRESVQRQSGGSAAAAEERLLRERGQTLEEYLRDQRESYLVGVGVWSDLIDRVQVTWRDVQQRYAAQPERFNPPPVAVFRRVRMLNSRLAAGEAEAITARLRSGELTFEALAADERNGVNREGGGVEERELNGDPAELRLYGRDEALNEAARALKAGEFAGPLVSGVSTSWLKLDEVVDRRVSLYDAQLVLREEIRSERLRAEQDAFLNRLRSRTRVDDLNQLGQELLEIGEARYFTPAQAGVPGR